MQDLFKCFVGTVKDNTYTNAIWSLLQTNNNAARMLPGDTSTSVRISYCPILPIQCSVSDMWSILSASPDTLGSLAPILA